MSRSRILLIAPGCNPGPVGNPSVMYSHAKALAGRHSGTLAARWSGEAAIRIARVPSIATEVVREPLIERVFARGFHTLFNSNYDSQGWTAFKLQCKAVVQPVQLNGRAVETYSTDGASKS